MRLRESIISEFKHLAEDYQKKNNKRMTRNWWRTKTSFSERDVEKIFGTYGALANQVIGKKDEAKLRTRAFVDIKKKSTEGGTFFVTSIVEGSDVSRPFLRAIDTFCKKNKAKRVLLWTRPIYRENRFSPEQLEEFQNDLATSFTFNNNLTACDFMIHPTQLLPLTGLARFGNREHSIIVASPKQHMSSVPRERQGKPHTLWTTGTVSLPTYSNTRQGSLSKQDQVLGGLVVEVFDNKKFNIRPIQFKGHGFIDLGTEYRDDGTTQKVEAEAIVWGDLHLSEEDEMAVKVSIAQTKFLNAKNIIIHDVCSWNSVSAHDKNKFIVKKGTPVRTLLQDYEETATKLSEIIRQLGLNTATLHIVKSNHDLWVKRWVEEGNFIKDRNNSVDGAYAFIDFCSGIDPIEKELRLRIDNEGRLHFLKENESLKIAGYELGQHGENGANGSKGSIQSFGRSHNKIVIGHSHSPGIYYNAIQVGTNSKFDLPYTKGSSSWMHANCVIYPNGTYQLLTFIDKDWKKGLDKKK